jgi:3-phenylpropionate/cinnamic acid dioxygenase small subunit
MTSAINTDAVSAELLAAVTQFLGKESRLLDEGRETEWLDLLDDELFYAIPVRQATEPRSDEISRTSFRVRDQKAHVVKRVERLATGHAYSEVPPSRTLRLVGSIEITSVDDDVVSVASALLVYRQRGIDQHFDLVPARRYDRIRIGNGEPKLLSREVILTETSLATPNLGIFL